MASSPVELSGKNQSADKSFRVAALVAGFLVLVILALIFFTMSKRAWPTFQHMGLDFFTSKRWAPPADWFGAAAFIYGTVLTSIIAVIMSVPVSLGIALFITEVLPARLRRSVVAVLDLLAVVPSVVFGLWGLAVLGPRILPVYQWFSDTFRDVPVLNRIFGPDPRAQSFMTAGLILALMITPIITSLAREVIDTTPPGEKEAALALGATRWEMIRGAVFPHSKGGLVGAVMLGLGRAMGETIAVALVIGSALGQVTLNVFAAGNSLPAVIANEWGEADASHKSALIALAVTLFVITIAVNIAATSIVQRSMKKSRGV